ncbi:MAG TPA: hypothetical protein VF533_06275 [Solirubrobacteraceae bacterium]|jgi:hypothetical protein
MAFVPSGSKTLLTIPGLGRLTGTCQPDGAWVTWTNTTTGDLDFWSDVAFPNGAVVHPNQGVVVQSTVDRDASGDFSIGAGKDPGPRRVATFRANALQDGTGAPCGFQAQGTTWASP